MVRQCRRSDEPDCLRYDFYLNERGEAVSEKELEYQNMIEKKLASSIPSTKDIRELVCQYVDV